MSTNLAEVTFPQAAFGADGPSSNVTEVRPCTCCISHWGCSYLVNVLNIRSAPRLMLCTNYSLNWNLLSVLWLHWFGNLLFSLDSYFDFVIYFVVGSFSSIFGSFSWLGELSWFGCSTPSSKFTQRQSVVTGSLWNSLGFDLTHIRWSLTYGAQVWRIEVRSLHGTLLEVCCSHGRLALVSKSIFCF